MPRGEDEPAEFKISDRAHASWLLPDYPDVAATMKNWWLGGRRGNVPNWDLACQATFAGEDGERRGIILVEAKAHEGELGSVGKSCADPESSDSQANHERIGIAIGQAAEALGERISRDSCYQFSNRIATSWRLATSQLSDPSEPPLKIPCILIYLGFTGDEGMGDRYLVDGADWKRVLDEHIQNVFSVDRFDSKLLPDGEAPFWLLRRTLPVSRLSRPAEARGR